MRMRRERNWYTCFQKGEIWVACLDWNKIENGEVSWRGINSIVTSVQEIERGRKSVPVLLNDVWRSAVIDSGYVSSRFLRIKVCVEVLYGPTVGWGDREERVEDRVGNRYRLWVLGDVNERVRDREKEDIIGAFGVPGRNTHVRRVADFCAESGLCVGNTLRTQVHW